MRRKLTTTQTEEVLLLYEMGTPIKEIARDFSIHPVYIRVLAKRKGVSGKERKQNRAEILQMMEDERNAEATCVVDISHCPILIESLSERK